MNTNDTFIVRGLGGRKSLKGTVAMSGAKNAALKAMCAAVLFDGPMTLKNIPETDDVYTIAEILVKLGAKVSGLTARSGSAVTKGLTIKIDPTGITSTDIDSTLAQRMRASVTLTGPLLARYGQVTFPAPGGCVIGQRPIDLFLSGYEKMGASVVVGESAYVITVPKKLNGTEIFFNMQAVGPTETLMQAAVLAKGTTILKNCALEPEIESIADWLNACGASISGAGTSTIVIKGTNSKLLSATKAPYVCIPDRIETGSFLILGALCAEELTLNNCRPDHIEALINILRESGADIQTRSQSIVVRNPAGTGPFKATNVKTHEYPGLATDLQAPLVTLLTQAEGDSTVFETIYENRFKYTADLIGLGAAIKPVSQREILVHGPTPLSFNSGAKNLHAHDIRAGFAVVLAALVAEGTSTIENVHLIDRGYANLEGRLTALGAEVRRV